MHIHHKFVPFSRRTDENHQRVYTKQKLNYTYGVIKRDATGDLKSHVQLEENDGERERYIERERETERGERERESQRGRERQRERGREREI